jgi:hypothetical protein
MIRFFYRTILVTVSVIAAVKVSAQRRASGFTTSDYVRALKNATDIMVNDVTSPVAASRYYAYINLAANETVCQFDKQHPEFGGTLNGLSPLDIPDDLAKKSDPPLAVVLTVYQASMRLLPSGPTLKRSIDSIKKVARNMRLDTGRINSSERLAQEVVRQIIAYSSKDGFSKLSGYKRFTPDNNEAHWQPTAPGFMQALEPYWATLRPFAIDSASQYSHGGLIKYDPDSSSDFYRQMKEVYSIVNNMTKDQADQASFWDCNPYALQQIGHLEFGLKKISPGGHWMGITGIACKKRNLSIGQTAFVHAMVSIGLADAFITCWDTKYRYNRVRPETAIKRLIDPKWKPYLQTPPFPEYTSGHSVVSTAAAHILTSLFGDNFAFTDDTEGEFGLAPRKFKSFIDASNEAALSRLYGGIHYRDAVVMGQTEGSEIGEHVVRKTASLISKADLKGNENRQVKK